MGWDMKTVKSMSDNHILLFADNGNEDQPGLLDEPVDRPKKVALQSTMGGSSMVFKKIHAVKRIAEVEGKKESNQGVMCSTIQEETKTKLLGVHEEFQTTNQTSGGEAIDVCLRLFHEWLKKDIIESDRHWSHPTKCHLVSFMLDSYIDHVNETFQGLTEDQQSMIKALVKLNNEKQDTDETILELIEC